MYQRLAPAEAVDFVACLACVRTAALFPGMGAYSLLTRRIGARAAEALILSAKILSANEAHALGLIDVLVPNGAGEEAVRAWISARPTSG